MGSRRPRSSPLVACRYSYLYRPAPRPSWGILVALEANTRAGVRYDVGDVQRPGPSIAGRRIAIDAALLCAITHSSTAGDTNATYFGLLSEARTAKDSAVPRRLLLVGRVGLCHQRASVPPRTSCSTLLRPRASPQRSAKRLWACYKPRTRALVGPPLGVSSRPPRSRPRSERFRRCHPRGVGTHRPKRLGSRQRRCARPSLCCRTPLRRLSGSRVWRRARRLRPQRSVTRLL